MSPVEGRPGVSTTPGLRAAVEPLLFHRALGGRHSLQPRVRDRFPAVDRKSIGAGCESCLRTFDSRELCVEILGPAGIELIFVEVLRILVSGLDPIGGLEWAFGPKNGL